MARMAAAVSVPRSRGRWDFYPAPSRRAAILSVAAELPAGRITNAELGERFGVSEHWILSRTGIRARRRAAPDERLSDYATRAAASALERAGVDGSEVDLVLVATTTPDELQPNVAPLVAHALGARGSGAFDVGSGCTGFLSALAMATAQIEVGRAERVVVVGADFITRINNYDDRRIGPLFADGAGAVVVGAAGAGVSSEDPQRLSSATVRGSGVIGPIVLGSDGSQARTILVTHEERKIHMDGPEVFRHALKRMGEVTLQALARAGLALEDIDLFVYHQANARITRAVGERLALPRERIVDCIEYVGNSSTATLPISLVSAIDDGRLRPGALVLLCAFGSGFTWGAGVLRWGGNDD
jgi:3-oxoacyl-[acyl-carrier-protein] synthase-3